MMNGLDPKNDKFNYGIQILNSLNDLTDKRGADKNYKKFMDEINQKKIEIMEAQGQLEPEKASEKKYKKNEKVDPFIAAIKFIDDSRPIMKKQQKTLLETQVKKNIIQDDMNNADEEAQLTTAQKRREKVRIPPVYYEKTQDERLKDQNDLLNRFQALLSQQPQNKRIETNYH